MQHSPCEHLTQCIDLIDKLIKDTDLGSICRNTLINSLNEILDGQIISLKSLQSILNNKNFDKIRELEPQCNPGSNKCWKINQYLDKKILLFIYLSKCDSSHPGQSVCVKSTALCCSI